MINGIENMKSLINIIIYLVILYFLWAVGNGSFDITQWSEDARIGYSMTGGFGSIIYLFVKYI